MTSWNKLKRNGPSDEMKRFTINHVCSAIVKTMKECAHAKHGVLFSCEHGNIGRFVLSEHLSCSVDTNKLWHDDLFAELTQSGRPVLLRDLTRGKKLYPSVHRTPNAIAVPLSEGAELSWIVYMDGFKGPIGEELINCLSNLAEIGSVMLSYVRQRTEAYAPESVYPDQEKEWQKLGMMTGTVIHDINNLLMGILWHATTGIRSVGHPKSSIDHFSNIETAARRLGELCERVLNEVANKESENEVIDLNELLDETIDVFGLSLPPNIELTLDAPNRPTRIRGVGVEIQRAIINLLKNASEAIGDSPGEIKIRLTVQYCDETSIMNLDWDGSVESGEYGVISVTDNGVGIANQSKSEMINTVHTTKSEGHGLGLLGVKSVLDDHRGMLDVQSVEGRGTSFRLFLPILSPQKESAAEKGNTFQDAWGKTVLIIDDELGVQKVAAGLLRSEKVNVLCAEDGRSGLALLKKNAESVDAVLLDVHTPGMDCKTIFKGIVNVAPNCGVVLSSGVYDAREISEIDASSSPVFLQKPYLKGDLFSALAESVGYVCDSKTG